MKKLLYVFAAFLCFILITPNQADAQLGIRAGVNMANISGDMTDGLESNLGFHFGIDYEKAIGESLTFRPGLLYSGKGTKFDVIDEAANLSYLEIPLDLVFPLGGGLAVNAGPYLGFLMSAKQGDVDFKEDINTLDFGLNLGLGYDVDPFTIGLGYGLGLTNINDSESTDASNKNTNITLYVVYNL
jgi:hypothetical protein